MSLIAAFCWDSSHKSISYMIIDDSYNVKCKPKFKELKQENLDVFQAEAKEMIESFFNEMIAIQKISNSCNVKVEYKIVGHASGANQYHTQMHKPSDRTEFVRCEFMKGYELIHASNAVQLSKQYRRNLRKPYLTEFKKRLNELSLIEQVKSNGYQYHLWILACHATKSDYKIKLKRMSRAIQVNNILPFPKDTQKGKKPRRAA